ncbi:transposase (plasmid) [Streptomyces sp. AHU1]|uniref:transposase n=1 Tax=Streptomyces sp. AHU1 TaxID=3377215 RepID=UPI003877FDBB
MLLSTVDHLTTQIGELDRLITRTLEEITTPPGSTVARDEVAGVSARTLAQKLDAVPGIGPTIAQNILAEIGADMSRFPTPEHLVSWAKMCPLTIQSGAKNTSGPAGKGNPGSRAPSTRPPTPPPAPIPSSAPATAASSNAAATPKPWSLSPARYSSSPGT